MKHLRTLAVTFDTDLPPWQLPQFRAAIAHKVGLEHEWFHNHDNAQGGYHQRYPLIQYKTNPGKDKTRPMLLCIENGIEEAHHFFSQADWSLRIGREEHNMRIARLDVKQYRLEMTDQLLRYRVHHWQALNREHYEEYQSMQGIASRYALLERLLCAHLLSFARGVNWQLEERFDLNITKSVGEKWTSYKDIKVLCFSLEFSCNLRLPEWIGLGKGSSSGFGVIRPVYEARREDAGL